MPIASSRKLAGIERALRFIDDIVPFNVVIVLKIEGDFSTARLRDVLDELQRRHRLLRTRILASGSGYDFHFSGSEPIPLEVCGPDPAETWVPAAEAELHQRFDLARGPMMRCRYLPNQSGGHLIVTLHHIIVDGASAACLLGEMLSLCADQARPSAGEGGQEGMLSTSALYPARYTGAGFGRAGTAFMARQMADEIKFRWHSRGLRKAPIAEAGRCRILPMSFGPELTTALLEASRRERITVNSILSAGLLAAVQRRLYPSPRAPLRHITFTDLRPHLRSPIPASTLGCHIAMFRFTVMVEKDGGFWPLARAVQEATLQAARTGERFLSDSFSPKMMEMVWGLKKFRMAATALSYTGPANLPASYGSFDLACVHAFTANFTLGPEYSVLAHLFRKQFWCDILYLDSDMDAAGAEQIAHDMQSLLESAAC